MFSKFEPFLVLYFKEYERTAKLKNTSYHFQQIEYLYIPVLYV